MGGPNVVRGGSHSGNVAAVALAKHGLLDMLSSDYVPGSLLSAVVKLVDSDIMTWPQAVALVSSNPAAACNLPDRGVIAAGMRGDLVQVHVADMSQTAGTGAVPERSRHGVVRSVWRRGQRVV
jgi:alpha-D-ribose 1-methylphosphonate 5-triphosphate diphosphatase